MKTAGTVVTFIATLFGASAHADTGDRAATCIFAASAELPEIQGMEIKSGEVGPLPDEFQKDVPDAVVVELETSLIGYTKKFEFLCSITKDGRPIVKAIRSGLLN